MSKFELLTKHIATFESDNFGEWFIDKENDGSPEHPIQMPYVMYTRAIDDFIEDVHRFVDQHEEMGLTNYHGVLEERGIDIGEAKRADIENIDAIGLCALIVANVRAERFCDGAILSSCKDGTLLKWLNQLRSFDEKKPLDEVIKEIEDNKKSSTSASSNGKPQRILEKSKISDGR